MRHAIADFRTQITDIAALHTSSLARIQLFAEVARIGYEHAALASRIEPDKALNQQLATYVGEQGDDFYDLHQVIYLRCWAVLETFVEDICVVAVDLIDWQSPHDKIRKIKCDLHEIMASSKNELASFIVLKISEQLGSSLKQGIDRFESILSAFELSSPVPDEIKTELFRLSKYRNCIMHNDGIIDRKLALNIPVFASRIGTRLGITSTDARKFLFATLWYVMEIQRRFAAKLSDSCSIKFTEQQSQYLQWIQSCDIPESSIPFAKPSLTFAKSVPVGSRILVIGPTNPDKDTPQNHPPSNT